MVNNRWARLSQSEKAELLGIYTAHGYNDLARIIADYNTYAEGGPYGVIPLGGDYLTYLQETPELHGGTITPSVVTAALPAKFNGSQAAAQRYAEGYLRGSKPVSEAMNRAGQDIFNTTKNVAMFIPGPTGLITWTGQMGADAANGQWGKVGKDLGLAAAIGLGAGAVGKGVNYLRNYIDEATNFGEDVFRAMLENTPGRVSTNFTYAFPATRAAVEAVPAATKAYEIADLGGGYMLKSLMRGNPLEKQVSKNGTVNVNNLRALVNKGSKVEKDVIDKVLASEEFAGKKSIDYNKFRKAVQDELITYERTPDTGWDNYGIDRLGISSYRDAAESPEMRNKFNEFIMSNFSWDPVSDEFYIPGDPSSKSFSQNDLAKMFFEDGPGVLDIPVGVAKKLDTFTFSSPRIPNGSGKHYNPNTLGHSRTYTTTDEPNILHVMESQSDWAQEGVTKGLQGRYFDKDGNDVTDLVKAAWERHDYSGNEWTPAERFFGYDKRVQTYGNTAAEQEEFDRLAEEWAEYNRKYPDGFHPDGSLALEFMPIRKRMEEIVRGTNMGRTRSDIHLEKIPATAQEQYLSDNFTSRQIQENLRYAAEKGQTKMRYPTRETAAKIEGYQPAKDTGKANEVVNWLKENNKKSSPYSSDIYEKTKKIETAIENDLATPEDTKRAKAEIKKLEALEARWLKGETTYSADLETVLSKYEGFPKEYQKLFKGTDVRTITDPKGNTWYEVDVPGNYLQQEWAYKYGGRLYGNGGKYPTSTTGAFLSGAADYLLRRKTPRSFELSEYRPTIGDNGESYYTRPGLKNEVALNLFGGTDYGKKTSGLGDEYFYKDFNDAYDKISGHPSNRDRRASSNGTLGRYSVTAGKDNRGRYLSFYDVFDFVTLPGKSINIYDRIYEDEVPALYNQNDSAVGLGDLVSRSPILRDLKASGGSIHIKPENRGKFTALKKRTGHSASWFKEHGTPAQKKMAVFALNARKWKHADGGPLAITSQYIRDPQVQPRIETVRLPDLNIKMPEANIETPISFDLATELYNMVPLMYDIPTIDGPFIDEIKPTINPVKHAAQRIMAVENNKTNPSGGWNEKEQRWYPHKSVEGGADTIAYGIKLSNGTPEAKLALKQGYLTDEQATHFADTLAQKYYDAAKRVYDRKYGSGEWDKLSDWSQSILTDFSYNPGLSEYPKLMEGFHSGNMDIIMSEYKRHSGGKELGRNKVIREELELLGKEHPIFRKCGGKIKKYGGKITQFSDISSIF